MGLRSRRSDASLTEDEVSVLCRFRVAERARGQPPNLSGGSWRYQAVHLKSLRRRHNRPAWPP